MMYPVPSVVISDGTPKTVVTIPLMPPMTTASSRIVITMARNVGTPESTKKCMT